MIITPTVSTKAGQAPSATITMELHPTNTTTGFQTAATTDQIVRDAYLPYGAQQGDTDLDIERGWLGQYEDTSTGLTYLNARYYNPALGRFLSPDPLMNPTDPRTLDPYRYADNNPISYNDASGLNPACGGMKALARASCYASYGATVATDPRAKEHQQTTLTILRDVQHLRSMAALKYDVPIGARNVPDLKHQAQSAVRGGATLVNESEVVRRAYTEALWRAAREMRKSLAGGGQNFWDGLSGTDLIETNAAMSAIWNDGADLYQTRGVCSLGVMECFVNANFDYGAITAGHTVLWGPSRKDWEDRIVTKAIDVHEYVHVKQVESFGGIPFYILYGVAAPVGVAGDFFTFRVPDIHDSNPFEKLADGEAGRYCDNLVWSKCGVS